MDFDKKPLIVDKQILLLKDRGMVIGNTEKAKMYLSNISYYRLSAYWYTFLDEPKSGIKMIITTLGLDTKRK